MGISHNILHRDGTNKVYQSPATTGQYLYFTNRGDDIENKIIGKGTPLHIENPEGLEEVTIDVQFLEDVQLKDAYFFWEGAVWGDSISAEVVLPANTPYEKTDNRGNAAKNAEGVVSYITASQAPDETWVGTHILFPIDITLVRFVNDFHMFGTNNIGTLFESSGVALIEKELKLKLIYNSESEIKNPNIKLSVTVEVFRENTV